MSWIWYLIIAAILASIIAGQSSAPSGSTGAGSGPQGSNKCDACNADMAWYAGLKPVKKALFSAWYTARWIACKSIGC